jgi:hypothetical protein
MNTCEHCRDRLLDFAYGLLEGSELQETREHLNSCSKCQSALEGAQAEQKLLARAAHAITQVAEFALPAEKPLPETVPLTPVAEPKRSAWRRPWLAWTTAAAVLVALSASISYYRHTVHGYQEVLAEKRKEHTLIAAQFTALPTQYKTLHDAAVAEVRANAGPYLHVVGPTTLQPGAKAHLHVTSYHPEGTPRQVKDDFARSNIRIKLVEAKTGKVVQVLRPKCDDDGHAVAELDTIHAAPGCELNVLVEAEVGSKHARVQETVQMLAPTYVTRIDTNKIAYQLKDVLFFRVLVLDRFSLQPPSQPVPLHVELLNPQGQIVRSFDAATGAGGILAKEFLIDEKFGDGNYTLSVRSADPAKAHVQSVSQRLEIVRDLRVPDFQFDRDRYLPGDQLTGVYRGSQPLPKKVLIGNEQVPLTVEPELTSPAPGGFAGGGAYGVKEFKKDATLAATPAMRFAAPIPKNLPTGANSVTLSLPPTADGKKNLQADIPLGPTDFTIDFFPEGGDLIAGVLNRAFYRVRSKSGEPVTGEGQVMLLTSKNEIVDSSYQLGMGYLDFVPNVKDVYTVRITTPAKVENLPAPFAKLGIRPEGVVIQVASRDDERVPNAVGNQGDPIRLTLRQQGPARKLLLLAQCRGQIVDQRWVEVKRDAVDVTLDPTQEATGMIRVTAYELQDKMLQPVAERLVYRTATQRLDLGFKLNTQQLRPGPVSASATARDEKGQPVAAWLLASVVDERFQTRPRSLSAHFFLFNEIRTGPDLDNAQLILHDSAESTQVLERFLGTHGWRRFLRSDEPTIAMHNGNAKALAQPLIFSRENMPLEAMQKQYEEKLAQALTPIRTKGFLEKEELEFERDQAAEAVVLAVSDLNRFEKLIQDSIRLAMGILLAVLLAASLILMGIGAYRIARDQKAATPAFGSSFACLAATLGLLFVGSLIGPPSLTPAPSLVASHGPPGGDILLKLNVESAKIPVVERGTEKAPTGAYALNAAKREDRQAAESTDERKADELAAKEVAQALRNKSAQAFARREMSEGAIMARGQESQNAAKGTPAWSARALAKGGVISAADAGGPAKSIDKKSAPPTAPLHEKAKSSVEQDRDAVQYFYQFVPNVQSDTLLWSPTLWLPDGNAAVRFDFASGSATYRVLLLAHSPTGRFGFYETRLDVLGR